MNVPADKIEAVIRKNGIEYSCSFHGISPGGKRKYATTVYGPDDKRMWGDMIYNPETGNFVFEGEVPETLHELEQELSDAIQNHHL